MQAIQELQKILPIERAQMRLRFEVPSKAGKELKQALQPHIAAVEEEEYGINAELVSEAVQRVCAAVNQMVLVESLQHFCTELNTFLTLAGHSDRSGRVPSCG